MSLKSTATGTRALIVEGPDLEKLEDLAALGLRFIEQHQDKRSGECAEFDGLRVMQLRSLAERIRLV